jgi:hypothetical protein
MHGFHSFSSRKQLDEINNNVFDYEIIMDNHCLLAISNKGQKRRCVGDETEKGYLGRMSTVSKIIVKNPRLSGLLDRPITVGKLPRL